MLLSFVLTAFVSVSSVSSLATPRSSHLHARHAALHARVAAAEPLVAPQARNKTKRQTGKCKPRPSSVAPSSAAATSSKATSSSTPAPQPSVAPVNVAPAPPAPAPPAPAPPAAKPSPTTTPKAAPPPTTTPTAPKSTPTSNNGGSPPSGGGATPFGSFFSGVQTGGDGTFYTPGLGACGGNNDESQLVAAIPFGMWDGVPGYNGVNPNNNPVCGHEIKVSYGGNSVTVKVVDECMGCTIPTSLDMSPTAFQMLAPLSVGRIHGITWEWAS